MEKGRFLSILVGALLVSACTKDPNGGQNPILTASSPATLPPNLEATPLLPTFTPEATPFLFDYCRQPETPSLFDQQTENGPSDPSLPVKNIWQGDMESLSTMQLTKEAVRGFRDDLVVGRDSIRILLVPVGYNAEEINQRFSYFVDVLRRVYKEVGQLDFGYLGVNIPIGINVIGSNWITNTSNAEVDQAQTLIRSVYPKVGYATDIVYVVNGVESSDGFWTPIFASGGPDTGALTVAHIVGHLFNLGDEYKAHYRDIPDNLASSYGIGLFSSPESQLQREALRNFDSDPPYGQVGTCNGRPVYEFYPDIDNIMRLVKLQDDMTLLAVLDRRESVINPVQVAIANHSVSERLRLTLPQK